MPQALLCLVLPAMNAACSGESDGKPNDGTGGSRGGSSGGSGAGGALAVNGGSGGTRSGSGGAGGAMAGSPGSGGALPDGGGSGGTSAGGADGGASGGNTGSRDGSGGKSTGPPERTCSARTAKPDATNTGVPPGTTLAIVEGDQTFSEDGAIITGKDFHGFVKVTGNGITFANCIFRGRATDRNTGLIDTQPGMATWILDSEFVPRNPSATIDVLWIDDTTVCRANVHGGVDGIKAWDNSVIQDSYIHDMSWFASDPNQGGGPTHNDGVQLFANVKHVTLRHNNIDMSTTRDGNAALQASAFDVHIEGNWLDGGGCTLNFAHQSVKGPLTDIWVVTNRFGRHSSFDCPILLSTQTTLTENRGNVWDDTGAPIPAPQRHD